jgi:hypothetical protein
MPTFASLPALTRRALAMRELRRRGIRPEADDAALRAAFDAFYSGLGMRPSGMEFELAIREMGKRIDSNTLTADDSRLFSSIPSGSVSGVEIARTFVQIFDEL